MQHATPGLTWSEWIEANDDRDPATKLAALREYIFETAQQWEGRERITASWLNKKLAALGITERIDRQAAYTVRAPVTAEVELIVYSNYRAGALEKVTQLLDGTLSYTTCKVEVAGTPEITAGPEDPPSGLDDDAPQTVDATLATLREVIMYGHIAGPKYCRTGADAILEQYGLGPIPDRKTFRVSRPVEAVASTTVEAYDEESAMRVAGWRWDNDRSGYTMNDALATDDPQVVAAG